MGLYSWSLNISDVYIYHSNGPIPANEVFTKIIQAVRATDGENIDRFNDVIKATKKFVPKYNLPTKTLEMDSGLDYTDPGKTIKYFRSNQLLVFIDNTYEFTYNIEKSFLSILIKNEGKLFYYKNQVSNLKKVNEIIKSKMSGLCAVVERNPQESPDVIQQVDAIRTNRNMTINRDKVNVPTILELETSNVVVDKDHAGATAFGKIVERSEEGMKNDQEDITITG